MITTLLFKQAFGFVKKEDLSDTKEQSNVEERFTASHRECFSPDSPVNINEADILQQKNNICNR